jgi:nucleoside-diphosphate-sugar epimerase
MARHFRESGYSVTGLDSGLFDGCDFRGLDTAGLERRCDIRDVCERDVQGFDVVVHLAALCNDPMGDLNPELTLEINHKAGVRLARIAREVGVHRFLYASSCSIYGASADETCNEDAPLRPLTPYALSKVRSEQDISKLACSGFSPVFMRNATAYGLSPRLRTDLVLNNLTCWGYATGRVRILSDGGAWRPLIHVEDIARAFLAVIEAPVENIHNQAFNVGAGSANYRVRDLAAVVAESLPSCSVESSGTGNADHRSYRVDFSKMAKLVPDFAPVWDASSGARQLYRAFLVARITGDELFGRSFTRLTHLKHLLESNSLDSSLRWTRHEQAESLRFAK